MAVGLLAPQRLHPVAGIKLASASAGLKKNGQADTVLIVCDEGTQVAAAFTQNAFCAAPVVVARRHLCQVLPRFLFINAGNANAGTGRQGEKNALRCCEKIAQISSCTSEHVLPFSTGVIGQQLPMPRLEQSIDTLFDRLSPDNWQQAAAAIMTTDTVAKGYSERLQIEDATVTITGIAKGSGMICPNMATLLGFIATDAKVDCSTLHRLLHRANERSFNSITVDGDTSTNDASVLLATGRAEHSLLEESHPQWTQFAAGVLRTFSTLAKAVVRDGEGATKFIEVNVRGGRNEQECRQVAYTLAHSPLVKTAFFASDPNVGRLLAAVGRSGLDRLDIHTIDIAIDEVAIVSQGEPSAHYNEAQGQQVMDREEITIHIDLGRGDSQWVIWTTDLSYDYVRINAEYRS